MKRNLVLAILALLLILLLLYPFAKAMAHDSWISRGGLRNSAGEWCCGDNDCQVIPSRRVTVTQDGYVIWPEPGIHERGSSGAVSEVIPFSEAPPSPDGMFWRCHRPDGTRRCFFAPRPNS